LAGRGGEDLVGSALHLAFPAEADQVSAVVAGPVLAAPERGEGRGAALVMAGDRVSASLGSVECNNTSLVEERSSGKRRAGSCRCAGDSLAGWATSGDGSTVPGSTPGRGEGGK
jgi:hypothetical protein